jgi:steroid delta-isomerase-like uncharacterized protein
MSDFDIREFYGRYVDIINAHDWDQIGDLINDTVLSHGQTVTRQQAVDNFRGITAAMPDYSVELVAVTVAGNTIASHSITRGTPVTEWLGIPANGKPIEINEITVYVIENGKFAQMSNVWDVDALRDQLSN